MAVKQSYILTEIDRKKVNEHPKKDECWDAIMTLVEKDLLTKTNFNTVLKAEDPVEALKSVFVVDQMKAVGGGGFKSAQDIKETLDLLKSLNNAQNEEDLSHDDQPKF